MKSPRQVPSLNATTVAGCSEPSATSWFGARYSLSPGPTASCPPHDFQTTRVTRPVGSPPLNTSDGLTSPKPLPWAKIPARRPRVGTAATVVDVVALRAAAASATASAFSAASAAALAAVSALTAAAAAALRRPQLLLARAQSN